VQWKGDNTMSGFESKRFQYHRARHELSNYAWLRLRHCDGAILSMHQSGTHWLKFMLASAIAEHYAIPPPRYNHANDIIGGPKDVCEYNQIPQLKSSHTIVPLLFNNPLAAYWITFPPVVLLIRDIRESLVSNYNKWQNRYAVSFSEYLRGDPSGRRYNSDIWWCIRFLNAWGRMAVLAPPRIHIVRYETLSAAPHAALEQIARHFQLPLTQSSIEAAVAAASKPAMADRADPLRPPGEVNLDDGDHLRVYSTVDREFVRSRCDRFLRSNFGYDYSAW
jgi:hypothetical protein